MRIALRVSMTVAGGLRGLACRQILHRQPLTSLEVLWRVQAPDTRLQGVPPHGRRRRRHLEGGNGRVVYTEGILLWVWPGSCSKVFLWADLPQPGG